MLQSRPGLIYKYRRKPNNLLRHLITVAGLVPDSLAFRRGAYFCLSWLRAFSPSAHKINFSSPNRSRLLAKCFMPRETAAACGCPCHPPNANKGTDTNLCTYNPPKKKKRKKSNNPHAKLPSETAPEATIDLTKAAWLTESDALKKNFAVSILEFCNMPLDTKRVCINCVRKWKTYLKKKHPNALEEHSNAQTKSEPCTLRILHCFHVFVYGCNL